MHDTLVERLRERALHEPDREAFTFLGESSIPDVWSYARLDRVARAIGARLQATGLVGQQALLLFPPGPEYVAAFLGCLYAGVIAVPVYPPDLGRLQRSLLRLRAVAQDSQARIILTTSEIRGFADAFIDQAPEFGSLSWLTTDELPAQEAESWSAPPLKGDSIAFLQYTSGSTATPKGVVLTHHNLLHNLSVIHDRFQLSPRSRGVIWLPPYHDMGLIGGVLTPIFGGLPVVLMSPLSFLQDPFRWLKALSDWKGTCSGGPNFAYELCVRKVTEAQKAELDLSHWELAFCGAEPVRPDTIDAFAAAFEPCGFRREAFYPCYGLAEGTLIVTGAKKGQGARISHFQRRELEQHRALPADPASSGAPGIERLVSCGESVPGQQVRIVAPQTRLEQPPGHIGEIWVRGPSVAQGYWNRPEETRHTFQAHLASQDEGPWLRTGDLGFLRDGELFVTGRLKDLLIIRGRNHYPQDIELTVERSHPALRPGCTAVFSVPVGTAEEVVVVQEIDRNYQRQDWPEVMAAIRRAVSEQHELHVHAVALIKPGSIPKTSSGKIQRSACRTAYLHQQLDTLSTDSHRADTHAARLSRQELLSLPDTERLPTLVRYLADVCAQAGGLPRAEVSGDSRLNALSLDSLALVELKHRLEQELGLELDLNSFLEERTLTSLAAHILEKAQRAAQQEPTPHPLGVAEESLPLTQGQRALWFLHQLDPASPAYIIARAARIRGPLNAPVLRRSLESLVERHAALRTTFPTVHEEPVQRVHAQLPPTLQVEEAVGFSDAELQQRLREEAYRPFDLERGPLLRIALWSRAADDHVLLISMHHIIADFWSLAVLVDELRNLYEAGDAGAQGTSQGSALPPAGHPAAYVRWQTEYLASPAHEQDWDWWRQQLSSPLPRLDLPHAPAPLSKPDSEPQYHFTLAPKLRLKAEAFSRQHGVTLYSTLLAAYQALLYRLTGQEDIIVGTPAATRSWSGSARLVGYCVNTLPLRVATPGTSSFSSLVARTHSTVRGALQHQNFPFSLMVDRVRPERTANRTPIFQTMFLYQRPHLAGLQELAAFAVGAGTTRLRLGQASLELFPLAPRATQFELTLAIAPSGNGLSCSFEYDTARFDRGAMERLAAQYERLLTTALDRENEPISQLSLLPEAQRNQHVWEWNATARPYRLDTCLHELVAAQAERTPHAIAVVSGTGRLTYAELEARARRLAARLRAYGVGPETRVGVFSRRTADLVVSLLAILKAGGAYVPLDPFYPPQRLDFILRDARAALLLTQRELAQRLPAHDTRLLYLDETEDLTPEREFGPTGVKPSHLAYVLYTSGSTGQPKGVAITHRNAVNFVQWAHEAFSSEEMAGVLAATSICFDLSVFEIFATLSRGGRVLLADTALHLPELPAASEVTLINTVPSAISELLATRGIPSSVRVINLAGEPLTSGLVRRLYQETSAQRVVNLYGPSETTTYSTFTTLPTEVTDPVSIGRAVANTQVYVLDANLEPVPVGVRGELFIGGEGVARGYLERPGMTAQRFVPDPFSGKPGARLYRTGDLVRHREDGTLEFLGRADHQVKVHGFRIELGEIELCLRNHPAVREAVVVTWGTAAEKQLVAYVVPRSSEAPTAQAAHDAGLSAQAFREHVRGQLPEYMVPNWFVLLDALPLTPNGKLDRAALPDPRFRSLDSGQTYLAPRTELEARIAAIWAELLHRERVGIYDNFFDLGGNSLLATRLASRLSDALKIQAHTRMLFEHQTIAALATHLAQAQPSTPPTPSIVALPRVPYRGR